MTIDLRTELQRFIFDPDVATFVKKAEDAKSDTLREAYRQAALAAFEVRYLTSYNCERSKVADAMQRRREAADHARRLEA
jgi:hypothetical protein